MYIVTIDQDSPEYLEHFGVLGMHWGVRNSETQRKYNGGQEHSEARTDIAKPTNGHTYQGQFKPAMSKDQVKMLKRAAAGVAIGAGLAAGIAVGAKSGALKAVAKHGAKKLAASKPLQRKGMEFVSKVAKSKRVPTKVAMQAAWKNTKLKQSIRTQKIWEQGAKKEIAELKRKAASGDQRAKERLRYEQKKLLLDRARFRAGRRDILLRARIKKAGANSSTRNSKRFSNPIIKVANKAQGGKTQLKRKVDRISTQSRVAKAMQRLQQKPEKPVETAAERKLRLKMEKKARKRTNNRILVGATGAALLSAPVIEGREIDKRTMRRKNGRHASTKWMRNNERLGS